MLGLSECRRVLRLSVGRLPRIIDNKAGVQKNVKLNLCLLQNRSKRSLRQITRMAWHCRVSASHWVEPDLMTAGGLPVEHEAAHLQFPYNLTVSETRKGVPLSGDNNCVIAALGSGGKSRHSVPVSPGLNELACYIASNFDGFGDRAALRDKARQFV